VAEQMADQCGASYSVKTVGFKLSLLSCFLDYYANCFGKRQAWILQCWYVANLLSLVIQFKYSPCSLQGLRYHCMVEWLIVLRGRKHSHCGFKITHRNCYFAGKYLSWR